MASLEKRETKSKKIVYRVRWYQDGQRQSETFTNRDRAREFKGAVEAAGQQWPDGWIPGHGHSEQHTHATGQMIGQWCETAVLARSGISKKTRSDYLRDLTNHLHNLAEIPLEDLTRTQVGAWVNELDDAEGLAPKTIKNMHGLLSSCLQDAVRDGLIPVNVAKGVGLPADDSDAADLEIPSASDFALVRRHLDPHWHTLLDTLLDTGLRWGEITALTVGNVDALSATPSLRVLQAWTKSPDGGWIIGPPKTKRGKRTVKITPDLRDQLLPLLAGKPRTEYVFLTKQGKPINHAHFYNLAWRPAVFAAQSCDTHRGPKWQKGHPVPDPCGCAGTLAITPRIHGTRHFHASFLIDAGVPLFKISRRLGHESFKTTADTYGHLLDQPEDEILAALSGSNRAAASALSHP